MDSSETNSEYTLSRPIVEADGLSSHRHNDVQVVIPPIDIDTEVLLPSKRPFLTWTSIAISVYFVLLAVGMIGSGFKLAAGGQQGAEQLFAFATNPFMGLIVGTLATALIQSSSTVSSVIVGLVAGGLPVSLAIPMIMGANIGTTITNTIVSLGHTSEKAEFKRAFSAATVHDFFNVIAVALFLPLEMAFGLLEKLSASLVSLFHMDASMSMDNLNFIHPITQPVVALVKQSLAFAPHKASGILMTIAGIGLIFLSISWIGKLLKQVMVGRAKRILHGAIGRGPISGIASGTFVTVLVQSSSTTTSLMIPLAGAGIFNTRQIYPFTLGANIGTCITALLAATSVSGPMASMAIQIALVHLIFNLFAVFVIYGLPFLRHLPIHLADRLATLASEKKILAFSYIIGVFFGLPSLFVAVSQMF